MALALSDSIRYTQRTRPSAAPARDMPFKHLRDWFHGKKQRPTDSPDVPRHLGELWDVLQKIAREERPEVFETRTVMQHAAESVEGKKDIDRWLQVYLRRVNPDHTHRFPDHHPRHRGYCLIARNWPDGTAWEAFDEVTFLRAGVAAEQSREDLLEQLDKWLDEKEGSR